MKIERGQIEEKACRTVEKRLGDEVKQLNRELEHEKNIAKQQAGWKFYSVSILISSSSMLHPSFLAEP